MIKIKLQQKILIFIFFIILIIVCGLSCLVFPFLLIIRFMFLWIIVFFVIWVWKNKSASVSELIIAADYIDIIYKKIFREVKKIRILKNEIEVFELVATIDKKNIIIENSIYSNTIVTIKLKNKKQIQFMVDSTMSLRGCSYQFILDLIKSSREIPNFKYEVCGNDSFAKKDIENYRIYGKHLSAVDQMNHDFNKMPNHVKGFIIFSIIICLWIVFLYWLYIYVL